MVDISFNFYQSIMYALIMVSILTITVGFGICMNDTMFEDIQDMNECAILYSQI